jgi:hypothetical protein
MKPENWIALGSIVITTIVTGLGLVLGPRLAVKRAIEQFRSTKWWEKQQQTYDALLEAVSIIRYDAAAHCEAIELARDMYQSDFLRDKLKLAHHEVEEHAAQGAYLISQNAAAAVRKLQRDLANSWLRRPDPYDAWGLCMSAATDCISVLSAEAKKTLVGR